MTCLQELGDQTVLFQEFLPAAKPVGCNELEVASTLSGFPDMKWQAAAASLSAHPPVTPILGELADNEP